MDRKDLRNWLTRSRTWPGTLLPVARERDEEGECRNCGKGMVLMKKPSGHVGSGQW